jgi:lysophospholipase L1-like esterase
MKLQTCIPLQPEVHQIDYESQILMMGSCFTENIGERLTFYKFQALVNPFGIVFHPLAIEKLVTRAINEDLYSETDLIFQNEQWHCFEVHSSLSHTQKDDFLTCLNEKLKQLREYLLTVTHIIFTYGTAWTYRFIETDSIVANCHKLPQKKFLKELLTVEEISASIENTLTLIKDINPHIKFVHTISPIRHLKDGFIENSISKAHLIAGLHELIAPRKSIYYFPAYEIMMDELRDYRFYNEDMIHPNKTAVTIIWEQFKRVWIASKTEELQKEIAGIQASLLHRPFNPRSEAHQLFLKNLDQKIVLLQLRLPNIKF